MSHSDQGITLTTEQKAIVSHRGVDLHIVACAGAGKTEAISRRIAALINENVPPESIVAFTFTNRAADELKNRICNCLRDESGGKGRLDWIAPMFVGTIHSYCLQLLWRLDAGYGTYDVLDVHRHAALLHREREQIGLHRLIAGRWNSINEWIKCVDVIANELIDPGQLAGSEVGEVYAKYLKMLDEYHFLTFGLMIAKAVDALQHP
ncbi:MAG: UvrD-helicase domain-containing protein, partial [Gemmatimonadaceae bacterium]